MKKKTFYIYYWNKTNQTKAQNYQKMKSLEISLHFSLLAWTIQLIQLQVYYGLYNKIKNVLIRLIMKLRNSSKMKMILMAKIFNN